MADDPLYKSVLDKLDKLSTRLDGIESSLTKIGDLGSRVEGIERIGAQIPVDLERLTVRDEEREKSIGWSHKLIYGMLIAFVTGVIALGGLIYQTSGVAGDVKVALVQINTMTQAQAAQEGRFAEHEKLLTKNQQAVLELVSDVQQLGEVTRSNVEHFDNGIASLVESDERHRNDLAISLKDQRETINAALTDLKEIQVTTREAIVSWSETSRALAEFVRTTDDIALVTITRRLSEANLTPGKSLRYSFGVDLDSGMDEESIRVVDVAIIQIASDVDEEVLEGIVSYGHIDRQNRRIRINVLPVTEKYASMLEELLRDGHIVVNVTLANFPVPTEP